MKDLWGVFGISYFWSFLKSFEIAIQLGAVLSIVFLYWKSFLIERKVLKKVITVYRGWQEYSGMDSIKKQGS